MSRINTIEQQLREALARAEAAEQERDKARRYTVEITALAQDGDDIDVGALRKAAESYGWGYLYTPEPELDGRRETLRAAKARLLREASASEVVPRSKRDRAMCKVLVQQGVLTPNGCLGYRLAKEAEADEPIG